MFNLRRCKFINYGPNCSTRNTLLVKPKFYDKNKQKMLKMLITTLSEGISELLLVNCLTLFVEDIFYCTF